MPPVKAYTHHITIAAQINDLIARANDERRASWGGPVNERAQHAANADALLDRMQTLSEAWAHQVTRR
jgi:hypothetical protein